MRRREAALVTDASREILPLMPQPLPLLQRRHVMRRRSAQADVRGRETDEEEEDGRRRKMISMKGETHLTDTEARAALAHTASRYASMKTVDSPLDRQLQVRGG